MKQFRFFIFLLTLTFRCFAQNENNIWYFGDHAGLDFNSGNPVTISNGQIISPEGCASISDNAGNLLFYTDGLSVWSSNHNLMPNGSGLGGDFSTTQSALIIPMPGNINKYYVFTIMERGGAMTYSIVDITLNSGFGDIIPTAKNLPLHSTVAEKQTAIKRCDGNIWLISHDFGTNNFFADLITTSGISTTIISSIGVVHSGGSQAGYNAIGYMKISQQGNKLALAIRDMGTFSIFDFDINTGIVSNPIVLPGYPLAYGIEFSPDGTKLYGVQFSPAKVFQFDLTAGSASAIAATSTVVYSYGNYIGAVQLAGNGKIYVSKSANYLIGVGFLDVINFPNAISSGIAYSANSVSLSPNKSLSGLPNQMVTMQIPDINVTGSTNICLGQSTTLTASGGSNYIWSGGISSSSNSITISPTDTTTYYVTENSACPIDTDTITVNVIPIFHISTTSDTSICAGNSIVLTASGSSTYLWSGSVSSNTNFVTVSPTSTSTYYVTGASTSCGSDTDTIIVTILPEPIISVSGNTNICDGQNTVLTASGGTSYNWSGGLVASTAIVTISPATTTNYFVSTSNSCGSDSDTVIVSVVPIPIISVSNDTSICAGESLSLNAIGATTYQWTGGAASTASIINVAPTANSSYTVVGFNGSCESQSSTIEVAVSQSPSVLIIGDSSVCIGDSTVFTSTINGGLPPYTLLWNNGNNTPSIVYMSDSTLNSISVSIVDDNGCWDSDTLTVNGIPLPTAILLDSISGCAPLKVYFNNQSTNSTNFFWNFGDDSTSFESNPEHLYSNPGSYTITLIVENSIGCADTLTQNSYVHVYPSPMADITSSVTIGNNEAVIYNNSQQLTNCILYFGDGTSMNGCNWTEVQHLYNQDGTYTVMQIVTNTFGCSDTAQIDIKFESEENIFVSNAFTPDNNGLNDVFYVYANGIKDFTFSIYNRWGELIFQSSDLLIGWDGTYKGEIVEAGIYVWKLSYFTEKMEQNQSIGHVNIIR